MKTGGPPGDPFRRARLLPTASNLRLGAGRGEQGRGILNRTGRPGSDRRLKDLILVLSCRSSLDFAALVEQLWVRPTAHWFLRQESEG